MLPPKVSRMMVNLALSKLPSKSGAVRIGERVEKAVDAIVTEPFLGRLFNSPPTPGRAENTIKGLGKLYLGFFRVAKTVLKKEGRIAIIFPRIRSTTNVYTIPQGIISKIETLGYTLEEDPLLYDRL